VRAQFAIRATVRSTPDVVNPLLVQIDALAEAWKAAGGAWTGLATNLEAQGKVDEALAAYQKVTTTFANTFSAPLALTSQARLLAQKGKTEEARRIYEQVMAQYQDNFAAQQAAQELRKLKK